MYIRKNYLCGAVVFLLLLNMFPMVDSSYSKVDEMNGFSNINNDGFENIDDTIDLIISKHYGSVVKRDSITITKSKYLKMQRELNDTHLPSEKIKLFIEYDLVSDVDGLLRFIEFQEKKLFSPNNLVENDRKEDGLCFLGAIAATLRGPTENIPFGVPGLYVFFHSKTRGNCDVYLIGLPDPVIFKTTTGVEIFLFTFYGVALLVPFYDINGGDLAGWAFLATAQEL